MTQKQGAMHGRDHHHGGADPAGIAWQSVGGGAGVGSSWAYAWGSHSVTSSTSATTWINLTNFYTNDPASFAAGTDSGTSAVGVSVQQPGMYRIWPQVNLIRSSGEAAPNTKLAQLDWTAGGLFFTESQFSFGAQSTYGVPYPTFVGGGGFWQLFISELWDYETASGTYPAPPVIVGCRHNASGAATGYAALVVERLGGEIVGGIN